MLFRKGLFGLVMSLFLCLGILVLAQSPAVGQTTVLVANFLNGNNTAFISQINLFNASDGSGDVTVRIFTLPPPFTAAQELTGSPLQLGTLDSEEAVSIQLDTDILAVLGIPLPYVIDGGRLVARFEIDADHVSGVVVTVFNMEATPGSGRGRTPFLETAIATYPLQVVDE